jgi:hypothetical protein
MKAAWLLIAAVGAGCGRHPGAPSPEQEKKAAGTTTAREAGPPPPSAVSAPAEFSAPIAAVRAAGFDVVAGLVVSEGAVRAMAFADGRPLWSVDALREVKWAPDAELRAMRAADGVALVWRGLRGGRSGRTLVQLGPHGELIGAPLEVGAAVCGTLDGVDWIAGDAAGNAKIWTKRWIDPAARSLMALPRERDPSLVCGDHSATVFAEGNEDVTAARVPAGDAGLEAHPVVVLRDSDFADEERDRQPYSVGETIGLVRVGSSGAVSLRRIDERLASSPWRMLRQKLAEQDEVVGVDGDATTTVILVSHEVEGACDGSDLAPEALRALRVVVEPPEESMFEVAPPRCDRTLGPFDLTIAGGHAVIAWGERPVTAPPHAPKVAGLAFRALGAEGDPTGRFDLPADALAFGGCEGGRCLAAALLRPPGSDGMLPEAIRLDRYP